MTTGEAAAAGFFLGAIWWGLVAWAGIRAVITAQAPELRGEIEARTRRMEGEAGITD